MEKTQKGYLILLMFISPLLGVIAFLKSKNEKVLLFFGVLFFGISGSLYVYVPGNDGYSHLKNTYRNYMNMPFDVFLSQAYDLITFNANSETKDIYLHCLSFLSASFFGIPELIHVFAGLILGYFFSKSVLLVLKDKLFVKKNGILLAFIVLFLFDRSLGALNSIRMWTGMWVFFYGTYSYFITKERKYLAVILFSIVVHFSYVIVLFPFLIAYLFRKRTLIITFFYLLSFSLTLNFASIGNLIPKTNLLESQQKANVIDSEDKAKLFEEKAAIASQVQQNFYITYGEGFYTKYNIVGLSFILLYFFNNKTQNNKFNFLLGSGLGLYSFSNIVTFSPSLSGRVKTIAALFIITATIQLLFTLNRYKLTSQKLNLLNKCCIIFLFLSIPMFLFQISYLIQMLSFFTLILPQISWILGDNDFSIRDAISYLF
ncbi:hypothetical protein [Flavobacterium sp.]|uniref:hypothetical protein n=1 Tax=Flavobacterium sp. TaxID=239 RepID=UPI0040473F44